MTLIVLIILIYVLSLCLGLPKIFLGIKIIKLGVQITIH